MDQVIHLQRGDVFAGSVEVDLTIQVGAQVIRVGHYLAVSAIGCQALEIFHLQWFIGRPCRGGNAKGDGQINEFHG